MRRVLILAIAAALIAVPSFSQNTDIEALAGVEFSFGNPGARSLGMGGAFLGLADDASAAEANPAGLTILRRPEVSIEGRNFETIQTFNVAGTFPDLVAEDFPSYSRRAEVNFGSVVFPIGPVSIAAYYHQPVNFHHEVLNIFGSTDVQGNFSINPINFYLAPGGPVTQAQCDADPQCLEYQVFPFFTRADVDLKTYGLAAAWKMGTLSLGVAGRYHKFSEEAFTFRTDFDLNPVNVVSQEADDNDTTWSAGFKWAPNDRFSVGGVYKKGPSFDAPLYFESIDQTRVQFASPTFDVPDSYGVGFSYRPIPVLTINADAIRVKYSDLVNNFVSVFAPPPPGKYQADDVTEIHAGVEYFFTTKIPFAIRGGWWRDPAHAIHYPGPLTTPEGVSAAILAPGADDQNHYTIGAGLAWQRFQIDAAYDTSDRYKVGSLSAVMRF